MKSSSIVYKIFSKKEINKIIKKGRLLGSKEKTNVELFLVLRLVISLLIFVLGLLISSKKILLYLVIAILFYYGSEYIVFDYKLKKRTKKIENDAIFYFQILSLTLESGNNLKNAIELTSSNIDNDLSTEFKKVNEDIAMGKSLTEALNDLKTRIPSDSVNSIILNLMESNIYGSNMIESLNTQLEYLNDKRLLGVKERINKMPIKISIASVLIFIPIVLLIILSPLLIQLVNS